MWREDGGGMVGKAGEGLPRCEDNRHRAWICFGGDGTMAAFLGHFSLFLCCPMSQTSACLTRRGLRLREVKVGGTRTLLCSPNFAVSLFLLRPAPYCQTRDRQCRRKRVYEKHRQASRGRANDLSPRPPVIRLLLTRRRPLTIPSPHPPYAAPSQVKGLFFLAGRPLAPTRSIDAMHSATETLGVATSGRQTRRFVRAVQQNWRAPQTSRGRRWPAGRRYVFNFGGGLRGRRSFCFIRYNNNKTAAKATASKSQRGGRRATTPGSVAQAEADFLHILRPRSTFRTPCAARVKCVKYRQHSLFTGVPSSARGSTSLVSRVESSSGERTGERCSSFYMSHYPRCNSHVR